MRAIDADALEPDADYDDGDYWAVSIVQIHNAPTIEPERKKGKWITNSTIINCSVCKHCSWTKSSFKDLVMSFNYCPNCGAEMDG